MGQATVSPDPLDESTTTTTIASADDLLAQLAGEEIDRLLAESEAERAATAPERADVAPPPPPAVVPHVVPERDDSRIEQLIAAERVVTSAPAVSPLAPEVPTPREPAATLAVVPGAVSEPVENADPIATATAERAALNDVLTAAATAAAHVEAESGVDEFAPLPLLLRPLEWLNAPLASCPEVLRESLGKVAIVTLVNAIAVLAYVLMFRKQ